MNDLGRRLAALPVPGEEAARLRAGATAGAAFRERAVIRRRSPLAPVAAALAALSLTAAAIAATGQGDRVTRWLLDPAPAAAPLDGLPGAGRLLALGPQGAQLLDAEGRRALGSFTDATWSPHGMFVAGVRGRELAAVDPAGEVRWSLTARGTVRDPRWGPDGFRIAYRSGPGLRVVAGDGSGDRLVARAVAPVAPAWRPDATHVLAYAAPQGAIRLAHADEGRTRPAGLRLPAATWVGWAGPRRLLAASPQRLIAREREWVPPRGARIASTAVSPGATRVALLLRADGLSRVLLLDARTLRPARSLLTVRGTARDLVWSPDGRWLATSQPAAGRWLLVATSGPRRARALPGRVRPRAWCC